MSSKATKTFERAYKKAVLARPGEPADLTVEEHELLLELIRLHDQHCTDPQRPNCRDKGGYLKRKPYTTREIENFRRLGLLI